MVTEVNGFVRRSELADFLRFKEDNPERESDLLQQVLDAALAIVADRVGPLTTADREYAVRSSGTALVLPVMGVDAVLSVTTSGGVDLPLARLDVDAAAGVVHVPRAQDGTWTVRVRTRPPEGADAALKLATLVIAAHLWEVQAPSKNGTGRIAAAPGQGAFVPKGYAIPARAAELIAPFTQLGGFA